MNNIVVILEILENIYEIFFFIKQITFLKTFYFSNKVQFDLKLDLKYFDMRQLTQLFRFSYWAPQLE